MRTTPRPLLPRRRRQARRIRRADGRADAAGRCARDRPDAACGGAVLHARPRRLRGRRDQGRAARRRAGAGAAAVLRRRAGPRPLRPVPVPQHQQARRHPRPPHRRGPRAPARPRRDGRRAGGEPPPRRHGAARARLRRAARGATEARDDLDHQLRADRAVPRLRGDRPHALRDGRADGERGQSRPLPAQDGGPRDPPPRGLHGGARHRRRAARRRGDRPRRAPRRQRLRDGRALHRHAALAADELPVRGTLAGANAARLVGRGGHVPVRGRLLPHGRQRRPARPHAAHDGPRGPARHRAVGHAGGALQAGTRRAVQRHPAAVDGGAHEARDPRPLAGVRRARRTDQHHRRPAGGRELHAPALLPDHRPPRDRPAALPRIPPHPLPRRRADAPAAARAAPRRAHQRGARRLCRAGRRARPRRLRRSASGCRWRACASSTSRSSSPGRTRRCTSPSGARR